jgi:hypothetical protein
MYWPCHIAGETHELLKKERQIFWWDARAIIFDTDAGVSWFL